MTVAVISPKKLIEVALPLDAINVASAREKSIRHGHPSTLHLWWARRPLAAARAVIFSQLVNDPEDLWRCQNPGIDANQQVRGHWTKARARLFKVIEDLVIWENTTNETVLEAARAEIRKAWRETCELNKSHPQAKELFNPDKMPCLHDPFAGGGTIPLEAQRLGLEAHASDLNPVAVLINKAMIEIPPKFADKPPVHPEACKNQLAVWNGTAGLAEDVRRYGQWMRDEAFKRIGHLYPPVELTAEMAKGRPDIRQYVGEKLTVIAWLWTRTAKSPNPAFSTVDVPLASTFVLSAKEGSEAYIFPHKGDSSYQFVVQTGTAPENAKEGTSAGRQRGFRCLMSDTPMNYDYIRAEGKKGRLGRRLMAVVAEGSKGRVFLSPTDEMERVALQATPDWTPELPLPNNPDDFKSPNYGLTTFGDLFTSRQLVALNTFCGLVEETRNFVYRDAVAAGREDDQIALASGGHGATAYSQAVSLYLAFATDKAAESSTTVCTWSPLPTKLHVVSTFGRQALPMTWDYAESNPFAESSGNIARMSRLCANAIEVSASIPSGKGFADQCGASSVTATGQIISTDPPYYDNINYADLSDFFYLWLRRSMRPVFPELLATITVPKAEELVAARHRHGGHENAERFFMAGMSRVMRNLASSTHPSVPITLYYAFKQSDVESKGDISSTGWETFLEAVLQSGLAVSGTWPMRTERAGGFRNKGQNALASSIILVCRPRQPNIGTISRRQFVRHLNDTLPLALDAMTRESEGLHSPVAPVDLSQAIIGPGMAIFSRYDAVLEADGKPMTVRTALQLINRFLAEDDFDADTQFCLHWFEQHGWEAGRFGEADTLARAKGTSVAGVQAAGVLESGGGNVRLFAPAELDGSWDIDADPRIPVWQVLHEMIAALRVGGETLAAHIYSHPKTTSKIEAARQLAYRLYTLCERRGWAEDARAYNEVVTGWSGIESAAAKIPGPKQGTLFDNEGDA